MNMILHEIEALKIILANAPFDAQRCRAEAADAEDLKAIENLDNELRDRGEGEENHS